MVRMIMQPTGVLLSTSFNIQNDFPVPLRVSVSLSLSLLGVSPSWHPYSHSGLEAGIEGPWSSSACGLVGSFAEVGVHAAR